MRIVHLQLGDTPSCGVNNCHELAERVPLVFAIGLLRFEYLQYSRQGFSCNPTKKNWVDLNPGREMAMLSDFEDPVVLLQRVKFPGIFHVHNLRNLVTIYLFPVIWTRHPLDTRKLELDDFFGTSSVVATIVTCTPWSAVTRGLFYKYLWNFFLEFGRNVLNLGQIKLHHSIFHIPYGSFQDILYL